MQPKSSLPHSQLSATHSCPESDKSGPRPHPLSWRTVLILSSHLFLGLLSGPLRFSHQILYARLLSPRRATYHAHLVFLDPKDSTQDYRSWNSTLHSLLQSRFLFPLRPKYLPQYLTLEHPQDSLQNKCQDSYHVPGLGH